MNRGRWRRAQGALEAPISLWAVYAGAVGGVTVLGVVSVLFFFGCFLLLLSSFIWKREQYWVGGRCQMWPKLVPSDYLGMRRNKASRFFFFCFFCLHKTFRQIYQVVFGNGREEASWKEPHWCANDTNVPKSPPKNNCGFHNCKL